MFSLLLLLVLVAAPPPPPAAEADLREAVQAYWSFLVKRDKYSALEYVVPESRNDFIRRREPTFGSWEIVTIEPVSEAEALVTLSVEIRTDVSFRFYPRRTQETWLKNAEGRWQVFVPSGSPDVLRNLFRLGSPPVDHPPDELRVTPDEVRIHFLSRTQEGQLIVRNSTADPISLKAVEVDVELFEVVELPKEVPPGGSSRVVLRYRGEDETKNRTSRLILRFDEKSEERVITVPIRYNYVSPGARGLLGLRGRDLRELEREDPVAPSLRFRQKAAEAPAPEIPEEVREQIEQMKEPREDSEEEASEGPPASSLR